MSAEGLFSGEELATLAALLDEIIPPSADCRLPGAGSLVGSDHFAGTLRSMPGLDAAIVQAVKTADAAAGKRDASTFAALAREARLALMNEVGAADPSFVPSLMFLAYASYYQDPRVVAALDLEPRPPHPKGFEMAPGDLSLLEPVRRRGKLYRDA